MASDGFFSESLKMLGTAPRRERSGSLTTYISSDFEEDLLTCSICLERFIHPKTLPCLHTFCLSCLEHHSRMISRQRNLPPGQMSCPTCRTTVTIPRTGIEGFPSDFRIPKMEALLDQAFVSSCEDLYGEPSLSSESVTDGEICSICRHQELSIIANAYCSECKKYLCQSCLTKHEQTQVFKEHNIFQMPDVSQRKICDIHKGELEPIKYHCQTCALDICTLCTLTDHNGHYILNTDEAVVRKRLLGQLHASVKNIDQSLKYTKDLVRQLCTYEEQLRKSYDDICATVSKHTQDVITEVKKQEKELLYQVQCQYIGKKNYTSDKVDQLGNHLVQLTLLKDLALHISRESCTDTFLTGGNGIVQTVRDLGQNQPFVSPNVFNLDTAKFSFTESPLRSAYVGFLKPQPPQWKLPDDEEETPQEVSPFVHQVAVMTHGRGGRLQWPVDCDILPNGHIAVADTDSFQVVVFDTEGNYKNTIGGADKSRIKPAGVAATPVGTLAITDILDQTVKVFEENGQFLHSFGQFESPAGIAVDQQGRYIVSDISHHNISVFDNQTELITVFGEYGHGDGEFDLPCHIAVNCCDEILVSDVGNSCIKVFTTEGTFVQKFSLFSSNSPDIITSPGALGEGFMGHYIVSDSVSDAVSLYLTNGEFVMDLVTEVDDLFSPMGLACDHNGLVVVTLCDVTGLRAPQVRIYQVTL